MNLRAILFGIIVVLLLFDNGEARKTSRGRTGGGWGMFKSRTTPRPRPSSQNTRYQTSGGSTPDKIGWNVPGSNQKSGTTNVGAKPSAPVNENAAKSSVSNVQSGYNPSGGYPKQPPSNPAYPASGGHQSQTYNPAGGAHPPYGAPPAYSPHGAPPVYTPHGAPPAYSPPGSYHPPYGQPHNPSYGQSYNPSFGSPYGGSMGGMPQQTILLPSSQPYKPGIGQLAKEAFVFAGVSAGVNAAVNRILPGGIYGTRGMESSGSSGGGGGSHTSITYNNYYNNGTAPVPAPDQAGVASAAAAQPVNAQGPPPANPPPASDATQPAQANAPTNSAPPSGNSNSQATEQNNPNPLGFVTSDDDLKKLTENLFEKDVNNGNQYITVNLQGQKKDESKTDDASEPLLTVKSEAYEIPTIKALLALHDNYELDVKMKETVTSEERKEESELLDKFLETEVVKLTMKFLADKGYIPDDEYEFKDTLRRIWFSQFKRIDGDASSSGFETVFLAERFDSDIIGLHNWVYFAKQEEAKKLNYLGYMKDLQLGKASVVKVRLSLEDTVQPSTAIFIGTSPELELSLYTMCFFTRPNIACPVSMGGKDFAIVVNRVNYFGKDILVAAFPEI